MSNSNLYFEIKECYTQVFHGTPWTGGQTDGQTTMMKSMGQPAT